MKRTRCICVAVLAVICAANAAAVSAEELVPGGDFESGMFPSGWMHGGASSTGGQNPSWADHAVVLDLPYEGDYAALIGFKYTPQKRNRYGYMYYNASIPANISGATLSFMFRQQGFDGLNYDPFEASIRTAGGALLERVVEFSFDEWNNQFKDSGWIEDNGDGAPGYDMTPFAGQTVRIEFRQYNTYDNYYETWAFVDNVSLVCRRFVDLAVDSNGDDVFGDPRTGSGGSSIRSATAGSSVSYLLDIENEGRDADRYRVQMGLGPFTWNPVIRYQGTDYPLPWTTPLIEPGSKIQVEVVLNVPSFQAVGGSTMILDAVSVAYGNRYDSVSLITNVVAAANEADLAIDTNGFGLIDPDGGGGIAYRETDPGAMVDYDIELMNAGSQSDVFDVWFDADPPLDAVVVDGGFTHGELFETPSLSPGSSVSYTFRISVSTSAIGGDYTALLHARSHGDSLAHDCVSAVTRVSAARVDMIISGSGDDIYDTSGSGLGGTSTISGQQGNTVEFPLLLQNEGGVVDSFVLRWTRPSGGWSAVVNDGVVDHDLPWITPGFAPFSQRPYSLKITISPNADFDIYSSILEAVSLADPAVRESVTAAIAVASGNETDLIIDGNGDDTYGALGTGLGGISVRTAAPGDTVSFEIVVENEDGANVFDLQWTVPGGWSVLLDGQSSPVENWSAGTYTLRAIVPASCPGGMFDVIVDAMKSNKRYFVDSVRGRIFVELPRSVDGLIDGDGDEVFGTTGVGDGGLSSQATFPGRMVGFTVELQNQGSESESYIVDWTDLPGWTALLGGAPGPYTTPGVPGGGNLLRSFVVTVPPTALPGQYVFIIDIASSVDSSNTESLTARIDVLPPPVLDLVIDGQGAFVTAAAGSGAGGRSFVFGDPGSIVAAPLEICNRGGTADSFHISWNEPAGWPAGAVVLDAGAGGLPSPLVTPLIPAGGSIVYTVRISVPPSAPLRSSLIIDGLALNGPCGDSILLEILTGAFFSGRVFVDADHDGVRDTGETGIGGVAITLTDAGSPYTTVTGADGSFLFEAAAMPLRYLIETTPSGLLSLSPDTVSVGFLSAGDTATVDFADVYLSTIVPANTANGPAGGFVDLRHVISAGTPGQASVTAALPAGWIDIWYRDLDGDGIVSAGDRVLSSADLDLDPSAPGRDVVPVIVRIFIPPAAAQGTIGACAVVLEQTLSGTGIVSSSQVVDLVTVLASASGNLLLSKQVNLSEAHPGEQITYTITFTNPGTEDVVEIEIIDPISPSVELVTDAFGPGADIALTTVSGTTYLTADPIDDDEALFDPSTGTLRVILSRQAPFSLSSGESGSLEYRVRIR